MSWRPMLRLAWRTALRSKGRAALIAVLVGLPVFAGVLADLVVRTDNVPGETRVRWELGSADAGLIVTAAERIRITGVHNERELGWTATKDARERDPARVDAAALLPSGSRLVQAPESAAASIRSGALLADVRIRLLAGADPLTNGMTLLRSGRYPTGPDEVAVSTSLGHRFDLLGPDGRARANATVTARQETARVVGVVDLPDELNAEYLFMPPETALLPDRVRSTAEGEYLVDLPPLGAPELHALAERLAGQGILLWPRDSVVNPENWAPAARSADPAFVLANQRELTLVALCAGFGLLVVVLLAGTAFAVGARRQTRELGLVAATGGTPRDVRRAVLAQGLVLGTGGALAGAVLAIGIPVLAEPVVERVLNHEVDTWVFAPLDYAALIAVGALSGLAAAFVPAVAASRMTPVAALSGRFRTLAGLARPPRLAIGLLLAGVAAGSVGGVLVSGAFADFRRALAEQKNAGIGANGGTFPDLRLPIALSLLGFTLTAFGLVRLMPAVISWIGALGRWLPLSTRLAFRDGSRHRHRTGPAAAAVMVVVAASTGVAFQLAGSNAAGRAKYTPALPVGAGIVAFPEELPVAEAEKLRQAAGTALADIPGKRTWQLREAVLAPGDQARQRNIMAYTPEIPLGEDSYGKLGHSAWVAGPGFLDVFEGLPERERAAAEQALGAGQVLLFDPRFRSAGGTVRILSERPYDASDAATDTGEPRHDLQAHVVRLPEVYHRIAPVVSAETASRLGWQARPAGVLIESRESISQRAEDLANGALSASALELYVERGFQPVNPLLPLITIAAAAAVTLAGVAISVALSASEGRADLATLAAIGAQPRRRRSLAAAQALLVSGLGCVLGIGLGGFLAFAAHAAVGAPEFVVPWPNVLTTAVAIPLFAALCAALFTRSELRMARRPE